MRFLTAGESHGPALVAVIEGFPAKVPVAREAIDREMARRQQGYGRGGRMKIERDQVEILAGVRGGATMGSPICIRINNRDWPRWAPAMAAFTAPETEMVTIEADPLLPRVSPVVTTPRPGHADLSGAFKYGYTDLRNIIERASARETAARVAVGAFAKQLLAHFGVVIGSYVTQIGTVGTDVRRPLTPEEQAHVERSPVRAYPLEQSERMVDTITAAQESRETLGGVFVVYATGVPPGLGSHVHWDRRLDGQLAQALMAIPGIKGVECGAGFGAAVLPGSQMHDAIGYDPQTGWSRGGNEAGGIEGGISNGQPIVFRAVMKPIPTLYHGLPSVDLKTREPRRAGAERSDLTAVPAAGVVAEAMVAWILAVAFQEKFGGDTLPEMKRAWESYREGLGGQPE